MADPKLHAQRRTVPTRPSTNAKRPSSQALTAEPAQSQWLAVMLDQVDHPMVLLADDQTVLHANRAAELELNPTGGGHPLKWQGGRLTATQTDDVGELAEAMLSARTRGIRKLLTLGQKENRVSVAVMSLPGLSGDANGAVLLVLGRRRVCGDLSVFWFARSHGLTQAESMVLQSLCKGLGPTEIAAEHVVAISTVRTQLAAIRSKTGVSSLRGLVNEVACLPPLMHVLGSLTH
jgi:DNA-binding CsgD family transcriptional regulator